MPRPASTAHSSGGAAGSVPVADLDVVRRRPAAPGLHELLEAHQVCRPLRAAVVHELDRLAPALVLEQDDRVLVALVETPIDLRSDPLLGTAGDPPPHAAGRVELDDFHVEATDVS